MLYVKIGFGVEELKTKLLDFFKCKPLKQIQHGLYPDLSSDLMEIEIREALYYFVAITGQVTNDDLLGNVFADFCIGK